MIRSVLVITMVIAFAASQLALIACSNEDPQQTYEAAALADYRISQYGEYVFWGIDWGIDDGAALGADLTSSARARAESIGRDAASRAFDAAIEAIESEFEYAVAADAAILSFDEYLGNEYSNALSDENDEITKEEAEQAYDELLFAIYVAVERADQVKSEAAERAGNAIVSAVNAAISAADIE